MKGHFIEFVSCAWHHSKLETVHFKTYAIMTNPVCEELLLYQPTDTEAKDFSSSYIVNCILNAFLTVSAIIFNGVTIQALRRTSLLSKPLKTLLLSLAVSDLGVGLLGHPLYMALLLKWILQNTDNNNQSCAVYSAVVFVTMLFSSVSFSGVMALSVDTEILGDSSSSQISGTGDSQACYCCSDLYVGVQCISCAIQGLGLYRYYLRRYCHYWCSLSRTRGGALL